MTVLAGRQVQRLSPEDHPTEQRRSLIALVGQGPDALAPLAGAVARLLDVEDAGVRYWALKALAELPPVQLAPHTAAFVSRLNHEDVAVRHTALGALGKLEPQALGPYALRLVDLLFDPRGPVRGGAAEAIAKIPPDVLAKCADSLVIAYALESLQRLEPLVLKAAVLNLGAVVELLGDERAGFAKIQSAVLQLLTKMEPARLTAILHWRSKDGNTALHIAAGEGHSTLCRRLVQAGALVSTRNHDGQKPVELAYARHHSSTIDYLLTCNNLGIMRGGTGDALGPALEDTRPVVKVEWYTIPFVGVGGQAGIVHSLLAVTVSAGAGRSQHTYVIEKAAGDGEQFKNGTFVSHWPDVMPSIESSAAYTLDAASICADKIRMCWLRQVCVELGPYDVATCNCHHAALAMYNACAVEAAKLTWMPNQVFTWTAFILQKLGVDIAQSTSMGGAGGISQSFSTFSRIDLHSSLPTDSAARA